MWSWGIASCALGYTGEYKVQISGMLSNVREETDFQQVEENPMVFKFASKKPFDHLNFGEILKSNNKKKAVDFFFAIDMNAKVFSKNFNWSPRNQK